MVNWHEKLVGKKIVQGSNTDDDYVRASCACSAGRELTRDIYLVVLRERPSSRHARAEARLDEDDGSPPREVITSHVDPDMLTDAPIPRLNVNVDNNDVCKSVTNG
jgi:hypothetical protein